MLVIMFVGFIALYLGYRFYSPFVLKQLKFDVAKKTPAHTMQDGVDYVPIGPMKNMMIQLLNIAGTGPVFGPIIAALFGPISLIFIPIGNIFAGAVMDLGFGVMSVENEGKNFPSIARKYMGRWSTVITTIFSALLLLLVATVFVTTPAQLIAVTFFGGNYLTYILVAIFAYYFLATILPVDKIIARFYPYFTGLLLLGTFGIFVSILFSAITGGGGIHIPSLNEYGSMIIWDNPNGVRLIPGFIVAVSCGFISGFHTTQSPIVSKTISDGRDARRIFYGMMSVEGGIAMIWAFAAMVLFTPEALADTLREGTASLVVFRSASQTLGIFSFLVVLAVAILPISSCDTAFRSLRSIIAEVFHIGQSKAINRVALAIPLFVASILVMQIGFDTLWMYFTWSNHMLSIMSLILITGYLKYHKSNYFITLIPAVILFFLNTLYLFNDNRIGPGLEWGVSAVIGLIVSVVCTILLLKFSKSFNGSELDEM